MLLSHPVLFLARPVLSPVYRGGPTLCPLLLAFRRPLLLQAQIDPPPPSRAERMYVSRERAPAYLVLLPTRLSLPVRASPRSVFSFNFAVTGYSLVPWLTGLCAVWVLCSSRASLRPETHVPL